MRGKGGQSTKRDKWSRGIKFLNIPEGTLFLVPDNTWQVTSPIYRYHSDGGDYVMDGSSFGWMPSDLFPPTLYVNDVPFTLNPQSVTDSGGYPRSGGATYLLDASDGTTLGSLTLSYTLWGVFTAQVSGSYPPFPDFAGGAWDGNRMFTGLPPGMIITLAHIPQHPTLARMFHSY